MAILPIITYPNPILKKIAKPVTEFNEELETLVSDMAETMYDAPGVGLAAPQVGASLQLAVVNIAKEDEKNKVLVLINPKIVKGEGEEADEEGCLSVLEYTAKVKRHTKIWVEAQDIKGDEIAFEAEDFFARVIQHELDHLEGILFIDRISSLKRSLYKKKIKKILKKKKEES